jgi:hypothetical protein
MLDSTVVHIVQSLGKAPHKINIRSLLDVKPDFQAHLKRSSPKRNTVRSYTNYLNILLKKARELGWSECSAEVINAWEPIRGAVAKVHGSAGVIRHAIHQGKVPNTFTDGGLDEWGVTTVRRGLSLTYVQLVKRRFRRGVFEAGFGAFFPHLSPPDTGRIYGIPMSKFPPSLRAEVEALISWKTAKRSPGRPKRGKNRPITAHNLCALISRIAGYIVNVRGKSLPSLAELLGEECVTGYIDWAVNQRGLSEGALRVDVCRIWALETYPPFASRDFGWARRLAVDELHETSIEDIRAKKERRWVAYTELEKIPAQIRKEASALPVLDERKRAPMMRDALLIEWMLILPWRSRNLREMKLLPSAEGGNLFLEEIPPYSTMARPEWVERALEANPHEKFWQFGFCSEETKTKCVVRSILPRQLLPALDQYRECYRKVLLNGRPDPGTLFLSNRGYACSATKLGQIVKSITLKYLGRAVNPHLYRDITTMFWLQHHPEDLATASKFLWHRDITQVQRVYGVNFDTSHASRRMEEFLDGRKR